MIIRTRRIACVREILRANSEVRAFAFKDGVLGDVTIFLTSAEPGSPKEIEQRVYLVATHRYHGDFEFELKPFFADSPQPDGDLWAYSYPCVCPEAQKSKGFVRGHFL